MPNYFLANVAENSSKMNLWRNISEPKFVSLVWNFVLESKYFTCSCYYCKIKWSFLLSLFYFRGSASNSNNGFKLASQKDEQVIDQNSRICDTCGQSFNSVNSLRRHKVRIHKDESSMPFQCVICYARFATILTLNVHQNQTSHFW